MSEESAFTGIGDGCRARRTTEASVVYLFFGALFFVGVFRLLAAFLEALGAVFFVDFFAA
jgi:Na+/phosphate symporter